MTWLEHGVLWVKLLRGLQIAMVLGSIILVHELGHFLAARWSKMTVEEFSVGIGPTLYRWRRGGTLYRVCLFFFMGYVRVRGMEGEAHADALDGSFFTRPFYQRQAVLLSGALMNIALAVVIFCAVFGTWGVPERPDTTVVKLGAGSAAEQAGLQPGERIAAVDGHPTADPDQVKKFVRSSGGRALRLTLEHGAERRDLDVTPRREKPDKPWMLGVQFGEEGGFVPVVDRVDPGKPAYLAGIQPGDRIVDIAGKPVLSAGDALQTFAVVPRADELKSPSAVVLPTLAVTVERQGARQTLSVMPVPRRDMRTKEGATGEDAQVETYLVGDVGLSFQRRFHRLGLAASVREGITRSRDILTGVLASLRTLLRGKQLDGVGGPVAIVKLLSEAAFLGAYELLNWAGMISIMIGVFNLLPLPGLDGGRVLFQIAAPVSRYALQRFGVSDPVESSRRIEAYIHALGLALLLALMALISVRDVGRW